MIDRDVPKDGHRPTQAARFDDRRNAPVEEGFAARGQRDPVSEMPLLGALDGEAGKEFKGAERTIVPCFRHGSLLEENVPLELEQPASGRVHDDPFSRPHDDAIGERVQDGLEPCALQTIHTFVLGAVGDARERPEHAENLRRPLNFRAALVLAPPGLERDRRKALRRERHDDEDRQLGECGCQARVEPACLHRAGDDSLSAERRPVRMARRECDGDAGGFCADADRSADRSALARFVPDDHGDTVGREEIQPDLNEDGEGVVEPPGLVDREGGVDQRTVGTPTEVRPCLGTSRSRSVRHQRRIRRGGGHPSSPFPRRAAHPFEGAEKRPAGR